MSKKIHFGETYIQNLPIEIRSEGGKHYIIGKIPYNSPSEILQGDVREIIRPGAFTKTLHESKDIPALVNHNLDMILGRTKNGSLTFEDTEDGLITKAEVPDTGYARDAVDLIQRGIAPGMSFAFIPVTQKRSKANKGNIRELLEVKMLEVSYAVPFPAYPSTDSFVTMRSIFEQNNIDIEELTNILNKDSFDEKDKQGIRKVVEKLNTIVGVEEKQSAEPANSTPQEPETTTPNPPQEAPDYTATAIAFEFI